VNLVNEINYYSDLLNTLVLLDTSLCFSMNRFLELSKVNFFKSLTKFIGKSIKIYDTKLVLLDTPKTIFS
jgi:hypothetical protein